MHKHSMLLAIFALSCLFVGTAVFKSAVFFGFVEVSTMLFAKPPSPKGLVGEIVFTGIALSVLRMFWVTHRRIDSALDPKNIAVEVATAIRSENRLHENR